MHVIISKKAKEFTAKIYCDLGKNIISIGFASYFFKELPLPYRIVFLIIGVGLLLTSVYMISKGE